MPVLIHPLFIHPCSTLTRLLVFASIGLAALAYSNNTLAWGNLGHQVICDIAWRELDPQARQQVKRLVNKSGHKTFAHSCTWADRIKDQKRYDDYRPLHYINVDTAAIRVDQAEHCGPKGCVLSAIADFSNRLQQADSDRALLFLAHFIGDIHQPLHVSYAHDRGGSRLLIIVDGRTTNLHALWDSHLVNMLEPQGWRALGKALQNDITGSQRKAWRDTVTLDWANESLQLTRQIYQHLPVNHRLQVKDLKDYRNIVVQRLQMAGVRLAQQLQQILSSEQNQHPHTAN